MGNSYLKLKAWRQSQVDAFPIKFAFNKAQLCKAMAELGLDPAKDTDKIYSLPGGGGFIRKTDMEAFENLLNNINTQHEKAIAEDTDGTGYIYEMFDYELANHEFNYTHDPEPALHSLDLTLEEVGANPIMAAALKRAIKNQR